MSERTASRAEMACQDGVGLSAGNHIVKNAYLQDTNLPENCCNKTR